MTAASDPGPPGAPRSGLTPGQAAAAEAFAAWLAAPYDGQPFVLSGFAGTGKTYLARDLLALVERSGLCWTVVAPTHKAVGVIRQQLALAGLSPTWFPSTIHRLLRLKLRRQGDLERCEETEQTAGALEHLGLVLVDEASMVDSSLLEIALRCAHPFRTRLVFVGDPAQLPPVGEPESPVFGMGRCAGAGLTEVVRHQGPVLQLATGLRNGQLPCRQPPVLAPVREPQGLVAAVPQAEWLAAAQAALCRAVELDNPDHARILCYTNRALERLVPLARRAIHGAMADQLPVLPGEVLITRSAVMAPACRSGEEAAEEPDMVLGSNRELVVRDVTPERCDLADFGVGSGDGCSPAVIDTLTAEVEAGETRLVLRLLPPAGSEPRRVLDAVLARLRQQAREAGKTEGRGLWRRYFLVRDAFASLGPAAVLTVHRSQGSTFSEVFIAGDVFWPSDEVLRRQLVYVAVSRASQAVWLVAGGGAAPAAGERQRWESWLRQGA
ncbi:AAA family ATPase [Vulcanococcus limneticus]|uniref:AAA family ATPase n=1 Tax=Vulcanococcus limneticus TaxID=2170428 RepID=UPI000B99358E|nr:AAA family ATPase [Vulcanococcus limneticus]MCP9790705.1 AAA family ATPase [Vulcanococcus limneticus MW73D5]MCP9892952.1 AAA family ATPase [Vulcanococcus limneticus Candia 3F8]MCP9896313.1 AAA family ATPase [Vulcanococcus limneticus Candia 3B3]